MITHCPHCQTEFLLEDGELPSGGLTLQCASCRLIFGVLAQGPTDPAAGRAAAGKPATPPPISKRTLVAMPVGPDEEVTPAPGPPPQQPWRLRRESGETVHVDTLDTIKRWIDDGRARRDDLLTKDGVAWQRLANMRELIPAFEHAGRPDATVLVERHAFVVNVEGSGTRDADGAEQNSWPGPNAPLVVEDPKRRASTSYEHDKTHPFTIPMNHLHRDYPALWRRQQWIRWSLGGTLGLTVGLGLLLWVEPQWVHRVAGALYHPSVPEGAVTLVHQGYGQLDTDTVASLLQAVQTFKRATTMAGHYAEAHAGLAEAHLSLAETYQLQVRSAVRVDRRRTRAKPVEAVSDLEKQAATALASGLSEAQWAYRLGPESAAANRAMALYHEVAGDPAAQAAPFLRQARAAAPEDARVIYLEVGDGSLPTAQGIEMLRAVVERTPRFNRARYKLARLYAQQNDVEHVREQATAILAAAPNHALARLLLEGGPEVAGGLTAVVSNLPADTSARGVAGGKGAALPPAVQSDLPPGASYDALLHQGQLLRATHQLPAAVALYERAITRDKRRAAGYIGLAWCQLEQEQSGPAMLNFTRATELSPWSVEAHYGLAEALRAQGDLQQAIKQYRQVLAIEPDGAMGRLAREVLDEISR